MKSKEKFRKSSGNYEEQRASEQPKGPKKRKENKKLSIYDEFDEDFESMDLSDDFIELGENPYDDY